MLSILLLSIANVVMLRFLSVYTAYSYAKCHYAESLIVVMLNVMASVFMLSVIKVKMVNLPLKLLTLSALLAILSFSLSVSLFLCLSVSLSLCLSVSLSLYVLISISLTLSMS